MINVKLGAWLDLPPSSTPLAPKKFPGIKPEKISIAGYFIALRMFTFNFKCASARFMAVF